MNRKFWRCLIVSAICLLSSHRIYAQQTAFTYQGMLTANNAAITGNYDLSFGLFGDSNGLAMLSSVTNLDIAIKNGLVTAAVDFGPAVFTGSNLWLQIGVRSNGLTGAFTQLAPLQPITPVPYAITAQNVIGAAGGIASFATNASYSTNAGTANSITTNMSLIPHGASIVTILNPNDYDVASFNSNPNTTPYHHPPMLVNGWPEHSNNQGTETGAGFPTASFLAEVNALRMSPLFNMGFNTVVIDGGWIGYRDTNGFIHENAQEWPDGISNCVRYAHSLGIKVGIWSSSSLTTSTGLGIAQGWEPETGGHWNGNTNILQLTTPGFNDQQLIVNDATTFANWGIDYVKLELGTNSNLTDAQQQQLVQAFVNTGVSLGHPFYIMSAVGGEGGAPWMKGLVNAQRSGQFDIPPYGGVFYFFTNNFFFAARLAPFSGPGTYISTDIIPDGQPYNLTATMMVMASMLSSELCVSAVNGWSFFSQAVIDIDQDPLAECAVPIATNASLTVWEKPLAQSGAFAVMFLNLGTNSASYTVPDLTLFNTPATQMLCLDIVSNITTLVSNNWTVTVPPDTAYGFRLTPYTELALVGGGGIVTSTNANYATIAGTALSASLATNALYATNAQTALVAISAFNAFYATNSGTATLATNAINALNAIAQNAGSGTNITLYAATAAPALTLANPPNLLHFGNWFQLVYPPLGIDNYIDQAGDFVIGGNGQFIGNGAGLTNVQGSNVVGVVYTNGNGQNIYQPLAFNCALGSTAIRVTSPAGANPYTFLSVNAGQEGEVDFNVYPTHSAEAEAGMISYGRAIVAWGYNGYGHSAFQLGPASVFGGAGPAYLTMDGEANSINPLGTSLLLGMHATFWNLNYPNNNAGVNYLSIDTRAEAIDTNGNAQVVTYSIYNANTDSYGENHTGPGTSAPGYPLAFINTTTRGILRGALTRSVDAPMLATTNYGVNWDDTNGVEVVLNISNNLNLTNVPNLFNRSGTSDTVKLEIFPGSASYTLTTPTNWNWVGGAPLTTIPAATKVELEVEQLNTTNASYWVKTNLFRYTP